MISLIELRAKELGFVHIGFSRPQKPPFYKEFVSWIDSCKQGGMSWLERNMELRQDPAKLLVGCQTIISLAYPYSSVIPTTTEGWRISRYSHLPLDDYHARLKRLGRKLISFIRGPYPDSRSRVCVDSAPILERSVAYAAGLGFFGKNNSLIIPGYGSYFYLAEILTSVYFDFTPAKPLSSQCGDCRLCLEACPTGAIERDFSLNASQCLSYLTIEDKKEVSEKMARKMGDCFFGCDRCQEVCPFNSHYSGQRRILLPSGYELLDMKEREFTPQYGRTVLGRAGLSKIQSNLRAAHRISLKPPSGPY